MIKPDRSYCVHGSSGFCIFLSKISLAKQMDTVYNRHNVRREGERCVKVFDTLRALADRPQEREASIQFLADHMTFLKPREKVLICFAEQDESSICALMVQAVKRRGAVPVIWQYDLRWKTLLWLAFSNRATTIIGAPLLILGLSKMARAREIPLYIRNVVTAGYPCLDWMIDGIIEGLDCETWGCFDVHTSNIVVGFSCGKSLGVHIREDIYGVETVDRNGNPLSEGERGEIVLFRRDDPSLRLPLKERARIETAPCTCGNASVRLVDIVQGDDMDTDLVSLGQYLHSWSSVLDCKLRKGECGLELEIVYFPGEKLPELPGCAKRVVRAWNPEEDVPMWYIPWVEKIS